MREGGQMMTQWQVSDLSTGGKICLLVGGVFTIEKWDKIRFLPLTRELDKITTRNIEKTVSNDKETT